MSETIPLSVEVRCITKNDKRISHIGGPNGDGTSWKMSLEEAIQNIKTDKYSFYINKEGNKVDIIVASGSEDHLKTTGDDPDSLLSLPACE